MKERKKQFYRGDREIAGKNISLSHKKSDKIKAAGELSKQRAKEKLLNFLPSHIILKDEYTKSQNYHDFECLTHKIIFNTKPCWVLNSKFICPQCAKDNKRVLTKEEEFQRISKAKATKLEKYGTLSPSKNIQAISRINSSVKHLSEEDKNIWFNKEEIEKIYKEGNVNTVAAKFNVKRDVVLGHLNRMNVEIQKGYSVSRGEKDIFLFVKSRCPDAIQSDRKVLGNTQELDIFIPSKNIAIEYHGLYWHSNIFKHKTYHKEKLEIAKEKGIRLIQIWEDDWENRSDTVKKFLENVLGFNTIKFHARKCIVKEVCKNEADDFFNVYHMQGGRGFYSISYGLYYNNELISIMSFMKKSNIEYELVRFANKGCRGAFTKLLKCFTLNNLEVESILSFADLEIVDESSNVYTKNGFVCVSTLQPDYKYVFNNQRRHKFGFRKEWFTKQGKDINKTEKELADEMGLYRTYDSGKIKYCLKIR